MHTPLVSDQYFLPKVKAGSDKEIIKSLDSQGVDTYLYSAYLKVRQTNPELVTGLKNFIKSQKLTETEIRAALQSMVFTHELLQKQYYPMISQKKPRAKKSKTYTPSPALLSLLGLTVGLASISNFAASNLSNVATGVSAATLRASLNDVCSVLATSSSPGCSLRAANSSAISVAQAGDAAEPAAPSSNQAILWTEQYTYTYENTNNNTNIDATDQPQSTPPESVEPTPPTPSPDQQPQPEPEPVTDPQPTPEPEPQPELQPEPTQEPEPQPANSTPAP